VVERKKNREKGTGTLVIQRGEEENKKNHKAGSQVGEGVHFSFLLGAWWREETTT